MIHSKLDGLMGGAERLARVAAGAYRAATTARTAPSGSASYQNADGTRTVIGPASGDGTMATHVGDVEPPGRPVGVAGASSAGVVYVAWGGGIDGGVPADFDHVTCYISVDGVDEAVGTLNEAGIVSTVPMATATTVEVWATAEDDACLADGTPAHNVSAPSERATVAVTQAADPSSLAALEQSVGLAVSTATDAADAARQAQADVESTNTELSRTRSGFEASIVTLTRRADDADGQAQDTAKTLADEIETRRSFFRLLEQSGLPTLELGSTSSPAMVHLTNEQLQFLYEQVVVAWMSGNELDIRVARIITQLVVGGFAAIPQSDGNLSIKWVGDG